MRYVRCKINLDARLAKLTKSNCAARSTQFDAIVTAMLPALQTMIRSAMSDTMTVKDFAATRGVSERLVWQWLDEEFFSKLRPKTFPTKRKLLNEAEPS